MNKDKNTLFKTTRTLTFRDMDPAKIMFFGHIFDFAHDAYEQFVVATGFSWKEYFESADFAVPIRFSESDFRSPLLAGETYEIAVSVCSFGHTSFKMKYIFSKGTTVYAIVHLVHTTIDLKTKQKAPLPDLIRQRFEKYLEQKDSNSLP
jgi:acyl-CoA thioester hydrolase/1,4-dihydroxy-2-naphthoyl-CoA hydrolase